MTETESDALYTPTIRRAYTNTIYRDTPLAVRTGGELVAEQLRSRTRLFMPVLQDERASDGILVALAVLTLPAVAYSFMQLWSLLAGGSLSSAVRAFLP